MKKQFLLLAGCTLILASCGSNNNNPAQTQAQIDSTVNAKLAQHDAENAAKNDSTLKAIEKEKAEKLSKERHEERKHVGGKNPEPNPVATQTVAPPPPPPAPTVGQGKPRMGAQNNDANNQNSTNTVGNGKPKMGGK